MNSKKDRPSVLVLMATYNGAPWVRAQVDSIMSQKGVDVHLVISDDRSKDGTVSMLQTIFGSDTRVEIREREKSSGSAGANFGSMIRDATDCLDYDFVALADQDDIWNEEKLLHAVTALAGAQGGYSCAAEAFWDDGRKKVLRQSPILRRADFLYEGAGQGCTFVLPSETFSHVQLFCKKNEALVLPFHYHDWLIYLIVRARGFNWIFDQASWIRYRQHAGNEIGARKGIRSVMRRLTMISDGWYRRQIEMAGAIYLASGGRDPLVLKLIERHRARAKRAILAIQVLAHGRRKLPDRGVLSVAAALGYI
ncbi:glycosyltransferase [Variovorax ginsengisoli]|uniref:Rhamnosyltransferase n=1 Tax=Variovorax ginsengisoli TaxID=363844 RepID=A0ABT9SDD6_9BURK|nr:glycosyltransferase [Variovorax ginsengisoli]MDP9902195.1 rhamnosyltransferase [Variovorax ginsengisoli]